MDINQSVLKYRLLFSILFFVIFVFVPTALAGTANVSWNPNSEPNLAGYKIYYGTAPRTGTCPPGGYPNVLDVGKVTSHVFNNLTEGKTYYFSVIAYNTSQKESCFSVEVKKAIAAAATAGTSSSTLLPTESDRVVESGILTTKLKNLWQWLIRLFRR